MNSLSILTVSYISLLIGSMFKNFLKRFKFRPVTFETKKIGITGSTIDFAIYTASSSFLTIRGIKSSY